MLKNSFNLKKIAVCSLLFASIGFASGCRYDMQDQPKDKAYREDTFFAKKEKDGKSMGMRPLVDGTVPRGYLREDRALYTGKKDTATVEAATLSGDGGKTQTQDGTDGTRVAAAQNVTYPDAITEFPLPVTKELIDRGEERYRVFCIVCHGPNGDGNGMIVRRGFTPPPSYHTEQLRGAPVGHFYDVVTNGWGRMSGYSAQIPVADRWAIVSYIRTLQASRNPDVMNPTTKPSPSPTALPNTKAENKPQQNTKAATKN